MKEIIWEVPEYEQHQRSKKWYLVAIIISVTLLIYSLVSANFLFSIIVIISSIIIILDDGAYPAFVKIKIDKEGVYVGRIFYDYDDLKNFSILHKEKLNVSNLYFETKSFFNHRISIPIKNQDPIKIREFLLKFLREDYERTDLPLSEIFAKFFKI